MNQLIGKNKFTAFSIWRKDLVHINKVRDNHFRYYGENFTFFLLVRKSASISSHIEKDGTNIVRIDDAGGILAFYMRSIYWLVREYKDRPFDCFIAPIGEEPVLWIYRLLIRKKRPILVYDLWDVPGVSVNKGVIKYWVFRLYRIILGKILKRGDLVISGVVRKGLEAKYEIPASAIFESSNGIQPESLVSSPLVNTGKNKKKSKIRILYVGYVDKTRGAYSLMRYALHLKQNKIPAIVQIIGPMNKSTQDDIEDFVCANSLSDHVTIINEIPAKEIRPFIDQADICVCPLDDIEKYRWSYPVKIYEYLMANKPVVASDLPGISRIIKHGENGFLYSANRVEDFFDLLDKLVKDKTLREDIGYNIKRRSSSIKTYKDIVYDISCHIKKTIKC